MTFNFPTSYLALPKTEPPPIEKQPNKVKYDKEDKRKEYYEFCENVNLKRCAEAIGCLMGYRKLNELKATGDFKLNPITVKTLANWVKENENDATVEFDSNEFFRNQPTPGNGTMFLVGPDLGLTVAHNVCIEDSDQLRPLEEIKEIRCVFKFVMNKKKEDLFSSTLDVDQVYQIKKVIAYQKHDGIDWALIQLDRHVKNLTPLDIDFTPLNLSQKKLFMLGHPSGLPMKLANGEIISIENGVSSQFFETKTDAFGGNSGSPLLDAETSLVRGILVKGNKDYKTIEKDGKKVIVARQVTEEDIAKFGYEKCQKVSHLTFIKDFIAASRTKNETLIKEKLYELAIMLAEGKGDIRKCTDLALQHFKDLNTDFPRAFYNAGICWMNDRKDPEQAILCFEKAAGKKVPEALIALGICYAEGQGKPKDIEIAKKYFNQAKDAGCAEAQQYLDQIDRLSQAATPLYPSTNSISSPITRLPRRLIKIDLPLGKFGGSKISKLETQISDKLNAYKPEKPCLHFHVHGSPGIGKTELCLKFGNDYPERFSLARTIRCENEIVKKEDYTELANDLRILTNNVTLEKIIDEVNDWLEKTVLEKPWLIIYDNVESDILIPQRGGLILSNSQRKLVWKDNTHDINFFHLKNFSYEDTLNLFNQHVGNKKNKLEGLKELHKKLKGWPILLDNAATLLPIETITRLNLIFKNSLQDHSIQAMAKEKYVIPNEHGKNLLS